MLTISLPYDYEVAWVHGDGQVWFDTGFTINKQTKIVIDMTCDFEREKEDDQVDYYFGCANVGFRRASGYYSIKVGDSAWQKIRVLPDTIGFDRIVLDLLKKELWINGIKQSCVIDTESWGIASQGSLYLMNIDQTEMGLGLTGGLKSAKIYQNNILVGDLYPVVKENTVFLYNAKSGVYLSNIGTGVATAGKAVTTHDDEFAILLGKEAGIIPGGESVMSASYLQKAYKTVSVLPPASLNKNEVIVLAAPLGGFGEGQVLISEFKNSKWTWVALATPTIGVGTVTDIVAKRVGNRVMIRWNDPVNVCDSRGNDIIRWKKTRLLRKTGGYPKSPFDGILVAESTVRNYYSSKSGANRQLVDDTPPSVSSTWYYKFFVYSEDGVVSTDSSSQFVALEFDWSKMHQYIQSNQVKSLLAIGDVLEFEASPFTGVDEIWNNLQLVVAGFDQVTTLSSAYKHSVTLVARFVPKLGTDNRESVFDKAWGTYHRITNDVVTSASTRKYYTKSGATYIEAHPPIGTIITSTSTPFYYERIMDDRATNGSNDWATSKLREWLNATSLSPVDTPYITSVRPPLMALRQLSESFYTCIIQAQNITSVNYQTKQSGSAVEYTNDYVYIPSVTNVVGSPNDGVMEGQRFTLFEDSAQWRRTFKGSATPIRWWLRSPVVRTLSSLKSITSSGTGDDSAVATDSNGVVFVLTIG